MYQGARGRDRRRDPPPDQGHLLGRPYRDGDAHRARARPDEHRVRRQDLHGHPGRAQGARPAGRPDRRRSLPGPRRLASRRGCDRAARPRRLGIRRRRVAARRPRPPAHAGDRPAPRRRPRRRRRDATRPHRRGRRPLGGRWPDHADGRPRRRPPADPDASAPRVRDQRLRPGVRADPGQHGAVLLRLADRARPDAHRRRVRLAAVVLAPVVVRGAAFVLVQDDPAAAVPARPAHPADVGRDLRHLGGLLADHGRRPASTASWSRRAGGRGASRRSRRAARGWPS